MATAHAISTCTGEPGSSGSWRGGIPTARAAPDGEITLDFPAAPVVQQQAPDGLAKALGVPPDATFGTGALRDLLAVFPYEATVRAMRPDLAARGRALQLRAITITRGPLTPATTTACRCAAKRSSVAATFSPLRTPLTTDTTLDSGR